MSRDSFPAGVAEQLKWYVYRLIDPRNGETFYVGKGKGNRIFAHANGDYTATVGQDAGPPDAEDLEDAADLKMRRINEIKSTGLEVGHVVHRHGIEEQSVAYEVEAALKDAYPGLTNHAGSHDSGDFGSRHVEEIVAQYAAEEFVVEEPLILISINKTYGKYDTYDAVRGVWKINPERAGQYGLVLAQVGGVVVGAYRPVGDWIPGTQKDFPGMLDEDCVDPVTGKPTRWGFKGESAEAGVWSQYVRKRVPEQYRGSQNPFRYCHPDDA